MGYRTNYNSRHHRKTTDPRQMFSVSLQQAKRGDVTRLRNTSSELLSLEDDYSSNDLVLDTPKPRHPGITEYTPIISKYTPRYQESCENEQISMISSARTVEDRRYEVSSSERKQMSWTSVCHILSVIPAIFLTYLQLLFNITMIALVVYSTVQFLYVLQSDLEKHIENQSQLLLTDIIHCSREFFKNGCGSSLMAPALEPMCDDWEQCMNQDTNNILKSKESAVILADILNNFFGNLTDRTMYCSAALFTGSILFTNIVLSWGRRTPLR